MFKDFSLEDIKIRDCNKCDYLSVTEEQQAISKEPHVCTKLNRRVYHRGRHPILPAYLNDCPLITYFERDLTERLVEQFGIEWERSQNEL